MLDANKQAELEQGLAGMREVFPAMWWSLYTGCLEQGFSPGQSLELVKTYVVAQVSKVYPEEGE